MMRANVAGVLSTLILSCPGVAAFAQEAPKEESKPSSEPAISVTLKDGVHFRSEDGNLDATLGGYVGVHYRFVFNRPLDNVRSSPDSWFLRQVRPEFAGTVFKDFDFRVQYDFPTGTTSAVVGTLTDAYIGWRHFPEFSLRLGQFKEPFGQEQTTADRRIDFAERAEGDKFTPGRDLGVMAYGKFFDGVLGYEAGLFNGQGRGVVDADQGKEEAGRLRLQPFLSSDDSFLLKNLRLGIAGTIGQVQNGAINAAGPYTSNSAYLNINYLTTNAPATTVLNGERSRWGVESTWNLGPVGLRGEFWRRIDTVDTSARTGQKIDCAAWSGSVTWLLTGETKPIESRVVPLHSFDSGEGDWGALEVAFRADAVRIDPQVGTLIPYAAGTQANRVFAYSAGLNWYLTRSIRITPDFFWENFDNQISFSTGASRNHFFGGILRFQLEF
jgi:phosphate-selective porin OprO/OprP